MNKKNQFLKDLLAFTRYIHNTDKMTTEEKYHALVCTIGHDINGLLAEDKFFSPRCSGYSKLEKKVLD